MFLYVDLPGQFPELLLCSLEMSEQLFLFIVHLGQQLYYNFLDLLYLLSHRDAGLRNETDNLP